MDKIPLEMEGEESAIRFRDCFSVRYLQSAAVLCRLGYAIEEAGRGNGRQSPDLLIRHEAFILNSVLSTVAFLESTINELYADAADDAYFFADEEHEALLRTIGEKWRNEKNFDRAPMISKYQKILTIAGRSPFDEGDQAFANVKTLIEIRNHLMHYKREWVVIREGAAAGEGEETMVEKIEKLLRKKFAANPFAAKNQPFFPDKCLGHGCAEWAIINSVIVTDEFYRRLDLPAPYEGIRDELATR
ncbi:hypothetical protein [Methanoregula sp.]|uniref:hypothetical protein n=1 Tax=Methanoregula sp. TaxID=2052170 RepID=UPI0023696F2E|nr:hypothetical protein [Methanoregula sp.]MDD1687717.1 hypothetical protein [Methanoregula sp.]